MYFLSYLIHLFEFCASQTVCVWKKDTARYISQLRDLFLLELMHEALNNSTTVLVFIHYSSLGNLYFSILINSFYTVKRHPNYKVWINAWNLYLSLHYKKKHSLKCLISAETSQHNVYCFKCLAVLAEKLLLDKVVQWMFLHPEVINNIYALECNIKMNKMSTAGITKISPKLCKHAC